MMEEKEGEFLNLSKIEDEENYDNKEFYLTKLSCEICKRQFSTTNGLKNHKLIHDSRPFTCFQETHPLLNPLLKEREGDQTLLSRRDLAAD